MNPDRPQQPTSGTAGARRAGAGADLFGDALGLQPDAEIDADPLSELHHAAATREGECIGPYRLLHLLGRGGMGAVYAAQRVDGAFEQRVALKLLRSDRGGPQMLERFRRERAILARLRHPHIAGLLDGGITPAGEAWFAMELVQGMPLAEYAQRNALGLSQRLVLFRQICEAVGFAHRNLVVHRDLKPGNILIDEEGRAMLLDFGIAKLIESDTDHADSPLTLADERVLTPDYAAPEQILGQPVTTATDVYALGLLLYELLTGLQAQSLRGLPWIDMSARVRNDESPMPSRAPSGGDAPAHPIVRADLLRGDLDAIVLKALRKEPEQRYASVPALLDDIERHEQGHPVLAHVGGRRYRWSRYVRRNRVAVAAGVAVFLALGIGLGAALWQAGLARLQAQRSDQVRAFLVQMFRGIDQNANAGHEVTARELLDAGAARLGSDLTGQPEVQAELFATLGGLYFKLGRFRPAGEMLDKSLALLRTLPDPNPRLLARTLLDRAEAAAANGHAEVVAPALDEAERLLVDREPATLALLAHLLAIRIRFDNQADNVVKGEHDARALVAFEARRTGTQSAEYGMALVQLGGALTALDRFEEAERTIRQGLDLRARVLGAAALRRPDYTRLLTVLQLRGHYRDALELAERLYEASRARNGDLHIETLNGRLARAILLADVGRSSEAEAEMRAALPTMEANGLGAPSLQPAAHALLGRVLVDQGRFDEGLDSLRKLIVHARATRGPDTRSVQYIERDVGAALVAHGDLDEGATMLQHAADVARVHDGEGGLQLAEVRARQSVLELARSDAVAAERLARLALPVLESVLGAEHDETAFARHALGRAMLIRNGAGDAERELRIAAECYERIFTLGDVRTREFRYDWGEALDALGDAQAESILRTAAQELTQDVRYQGAVRPRALAWLARNTGARPARTPPAPSR
ncbi:MAG TPA: protein kinase [Rudaea sp.]